MKIYKVYGKKGNYSVYIEGIKKSLDEVDGIFGNYVSDYGYGVDNILIIPESKLDLTLLNGDKLAKVIEPTRVPYSLYKSLLKIAGAGYLRATNYDEETKTIEISKICD